MATATKTNRSFNDATEQVGQSGQHFVLAGKRAGNRYLDSYDKLVEDVTCFQQKLAERSENDAVKSAVETQVGVTRQLTSAYLSAARELMA
jgi:hypothetical protein